MMQPAHGWGRFPSVQEREQLGANGGLSFALRRALDNGERSILPVGNRRSYGDSCINDGNTVIDCRGADRVLAYDPASGVLRAEPGILLCDITHRVITDGWFLPVTPGTAFVTLGGAIANDVHGKNHHAAGSFGCHVRAFELLRSDGTTRVCTPTDNADWFSASIGGFGLTGLITWAEIQLARVPGPRIEQETIRYDGLDDFFALARDSADAFEHTVSWMDSLASGAALGRGIFIRGRHAPSGNTSGAARVPRFAPTVPFTPPISLVNGLSLAAFNRFYWWRHPATARRATVRHEGFFYPLDSILHWNRVYGPNGLLQHQSVVPSAEAQLAFREMLRATQAGGYGSFLTVAKTFGARPSPGLMSFAREGATLTLDFANSGRDLPGLLDRLDAIVLEAGGAINAYKDARMSAETFRRSYPHWQEFTRFVDPRFSSTFWRRVTASR